MVCGFVCTSFLATLNTVPGTRVSTQHIHVGWIREWMNQWINKSMNELNLQKTPPRLNYNYFSVLCVFYFVDKETEARQSHTAETHSWAGWVPAPPTVSSGPRGQAGLLSSVENSSRFFESCLMSLTKPSFPYKCTVSPQLCHSWLLLATSMFLLVDSMAARRLRPHAERQCAMGGYVLGFWRTKALSSSSSSVWELLLLGASHLTSQCLHFLLYRKEVTTGPKSWSCCTDSVR